LKMFPDIAPKAVENFVTHAKNGYYDGVIFHRVIKGFMIQGGDPTGTGMGGESIWGNDFDNEYGNNVVFDRPFLLAMANRGPNTNGSQFFITTAPADWLNGGYTIFGEVVSGQDVVTKIENVTTGDMDRPMVDQVITKATLK
jgi:peptidylprolyl isomerase